MLTWGSWISSKLRGCCVRPEDFILSEAPALTPWPGLDSPVSSALTPLADLIISMGELAAMEIPPREMIVEPFLPTSSLSMTFAARGVGKTWFTMQMACAISTGKPFFEWYVPIARRVLYVDGEMPLQLLQERFCWLLHGLSYENLDVLPSESLWADGHPLNLNDIGSQKRFQEGLDALEDSGKRPALIILDNLSSLCSGVDSNDNDALDGLLGWLMGLRHQGYAVMLVHHAGKSGEQRGASRREDLLDTSIKLTGTETPGMDGAAFKIEFTKTRGRKPRPEFLSVTLEKGEHGEPVWGHVKTLPEYMRALMLIRDESPKDITALGGLLDVSRQAARKHITKLRELGYLTPAALSITNKGWKALATLEGAHAA